MIKVQQVFDTAIHLMDEQNATNGNTMTGDTEEYRLRTISILNAIMPRLYPYSDTYTVGESGRPSCPLLSYASGFDKPDLSQVVPLDDTLSVGVLPYGLAAHLIAGENEELSRWFMDRYEQALYDLQGKIPASFEPITLPYGAF